MTKVTVLQVGARMHYAVPRILSAGGHLGLLFTDIWAPPYLSASLGRLPRALLPPVLRRLLARVPKGIPADRIRAFPMFGIEYAIRRLLTRNPGSLTEVHLWAAKKFNQLVLESHLIEGESIYVYNSAGLEILRHAKLRKLKTFHEQTIAPRKVQESLVAQERESYQNWEDYESSNPHVAEFVDREYSEWAIADHIVCGSEFVRDAIANSGGPANRCVVVPYGVQLPEFHRAHRRKEGPLRVLTIGTVELRKGSPYVLEAAAHFGKAVEFRLVGNFAANNSILSSLRSLLDYRRAVPRSEIAEHFRWADVFLLPSICEGSATVTYEALSYGLPVICTPNAGSVVTDGVNGFLVPVRSTEAIIDAVEKLSSSPKLLEAMSEAAYATREFISLESYGRRLLTALELR